jgi:hypothetical protein
MSSGEIAVKIALLKYILFDNEADGIIINEFTNLSCGARADLAMFNGNVLYAFEIKSDLDSCRRLPGQLNLYEQYFDRHIVVCTQKHVDEVLSAVGNSRAGVYLFDDSRIRVLRKGRQRLVDDDTIRANMLPARISGNAGTARALLAASLMTRYGQNLDVLARIKSAGVATAEDIAELNPHYVRKRNLSDAMKAYEDMWASLARHPIRLPNHLPC